jgi:CheY-like chemotaxis protein
MLRCTLDRSTAQRAATSVSARRRAAEPPLVLVVDDEPGIVEFLRYALEDSGYRVAIARDGLDALSQIAQQRPDFVLTDLMMPRLDGWELCRRLRADETMRNVPILAMSAVSSRGIDADAFLAKPFEMDDLLDTLRRCAARRDGHA